MASGNFKNCYGCPFSRPLIYTALISIGIEVYREYVNSNFEAAYDVYTIRIVSVFSGKGRRMIFETHQFLVLMILVYCAIMFFESYVLMVALSVLVIVNNFCCIQAAVLDIIGFYTSFDEVSCSIFIYLLGVIFRQIRSLDISSF